MTWNAEERRAIFKVVKFVCDTEIAYGLPKKDAKMVCTYFALWLEKDFTGQQVLYALESLVKNDCRLPLPSDIRAFLSPPDRKIPLAEYVTAHKTWVEAGRPEFTPERDLIRKYEAQQRQEEEGTAKRREVVKQMAYQDATLEIDMPKELMPDSMNAIGSFMLPSPKMTDEKRDALSKINDLKEKARR